MKSALSISAALLAAGVLSVAGTYAYFTHRDTERNAFTIGDNTSNVHEEFEPPEELTPGVNTYQKAVKVQNSGETDSFVRVMVEFSDNAVRDVSGFSADGTTWYSASPEAPEIELAPEDSDSGIVQESYLSHLPENWIYIGENDDPLLGGFYYYTEKVPAGSETSTLTNSVKTYFKSESDIKDYEIYVYAESVQTRDIAGDEINSWQDAWQEFLERR